MVSSSCTSYRSFEECIRMWFVLAILSALLFGLTGFFMKVSQMKKGSTPYLLLGLYITGTLGFLVQSLSSGNLDVGNARLWFWGILIGVGSGWGNVVFMRALELGPASLTAPLMNINIVLVILLSTFYYHEPLSLVKALGALLLITSAVLVAIRVNEPLSIREKKWFALVILGGLLFFLRNGGLKITAELGLANSAILLYSYLLSAIWFGLAIKPSRATTARERASHRTGFIWGLISGFFSYGGLQLYSAALQLGPGNIVSPIFSTYGLVVVVGSVLVYKERLTPLKAVALVILFIGLLLVKL